MALEQRRQGAGGCAGGDHIVHHRHMGRDLPGNLENPSQVGQPLAAVIDPEAGDMGSFFVSGYVMLSGCNCGWGGQDTEKRELGVGVFEGFDDDGTSRGIAAYIDSGVTNFGFVGNERFRAFRR